MSQPESPSVLVRFLDAFLQERNIKWVLGVGVLILMGSSLLFVTTHWETYTPLWKHIVLLLYAGTIHAAGQWSYHRLGLRRTGTVLQALMVLLIPLLFVALQALPGDAQDRGIAYGALLAATFAFSLEAGRRVFRHFLRGSQPTFLCSYLILAVAGAAPPTHSSAWAPLVALALWAVFAIGTIKVNRHVFWLTEENRAPRIFGFFPIALLGAQFLLLVALHAVPYVALEWLGFGLVLVAIPVLVTADTVAAVFQQRTGDLVRPLPWAIVLPLGVGLALCGAGVVLAGASLMPPHRPHALVFAAAGAAGLMGLAARRTGKQAFVWAMLILTVVAYNFAPVFFVDAAKALIRNGADVLREERLPYAFYGLSYVPLLLGLLAAGAWATRPQSLFAEPIRWFVFGLSVVLLAASFTHEKALFPVGVVMLVLFAMQARLFDAWVGVLPGLLAWFSAAYGLVPFLDGVLGVDPFKDAALVFLALASVLLLWTGRHVDDWIGARAPKDWSGHTWPICQATSLGVALTLAGYWVALGFLVKPATGLAGMVLAVALILQSIRWVRPLLSAVAILFLQTCLLQEGLVRGLSMPAALGGATLFLLVQWLLGLAAERRRFSPVVKSFRIANEWVCCVWLTLLLIGVYFPLFLFELTRPFHPFPTEIAGFRQISWPCRLLSVVWAFAMARRFGNPVFGTLAYLGLLAFAGGMFLNIVGVAFWQWLPALWATLALAALPISQFLYLRMRHLRRENAGTSDLNRCGALEAPITFLTLGVFALAAIGSLIAFPWPMRVAGGLGLLGLLAFSLLRRQASIRLPALILANWQVFGVVLLMLTPDLRFLFELTEGKLTALCLPVAFFAATSLFLWQLFGERPTRHDLAFLHRMALRGLIMTAFAFSLRFPALFGGDVCFAVGAIMVVVLAELLSACRNNEEAQVWVAGLLALTGTAYLAKFEVLTFGRGWTMFVVLGLGLALWLVKEAAERRRFLSVLARPFGHAAFVMPLITVGIGVYRHCVMPPLWLGANSLALLLAAGFYFWRGIEDRRKHLFIIAGGILNIALLLLWRELTWTDPQFFMIPIGISLLALVEVLREEIPERFHDPLRYLGALVILVSPTFHIVGGSWIHIFSLMVVSVAVLLLAIGLRIRALLYAGTTFLFADLTAMLVRGSIDNANVLWIAGFLLGASVLTLGAICERHRETLLRRMSVLADSLKTWS